MQIAAPGGCFFMRTIVFIDGQNLYHLAKNAWVSPGKAVYSRPSYDVRKLSQALVDEETGRTLTEIRFYTGVPDPRLGRRQKSWHTFWTYKIIHLRRQGIYVYRGRVNVGGQEKGVDVSLAIDLIPGYIRGSIRGSFNSEPGLRFWPCGSVSQADSHGSEQDVVVRVMVSGGARKPVA